MRIPVLLYHRIVTKEQYDKLSSEQEIVYSISLDRFEEQMKYLQDKKFQVLSVQEVFQYIKGKDCLPSRAVAITFDDGLNSQYEFACPVLRKYCIKATFFITTDKYCAEFGSGKYQDQPLTEAQIKQMDKWGFVIGSHTHTHPNLENLNRNQIHYELIESKMILERLLGKEVAYLSIPGGYYNDKVKDIARLTGYNGICISRGRVGEDHKDPFVIRRLGIRGYYSMDIFDKLISANKAMILKNRIELTSKYLLKNTIGINNYVRLRNYLIEFRACQRN